MKPLGVLGLRGDGAGIEAVPITTTAAEIICPEGARGAASVV